MVLKIYIFLSVVCRVLSALLSVIKQKWWQFAGLMSALSFLMQVIKVNFVGVIIYMFPETYEISIWRSLLFNGPPMNRNLLEHQKQIRRSSQGRKHSRECAVRHPWRLEADLYNKNGRLRTVIPGLIEVERIFLRTGTSCRRTVFAYAITSYENIFRARGTGILTITWRRKDYPYNRIK